MTVETVDLEKIRESYLAGPDSEFVRKIIELHPSIFSCNPEECHVMMVLSAYGFAGAALIILPSMFILLYVFYKRVSSLKHELGPELYRLNLAMFKVLGSQYLLIIMFLLFPGISLVAIYYTEIRVGEFCLQLLIFLLSLHFPLDALSHLFIIKPYRRYILEKFVFFANYIGGKNNAQPVSVVRTKSITIL